MTWCLWWLILSWYVTVLVHCGEHVMWCVQLWWLIIISIRYAQYFPLQFHTIQYYHIYHHNISSIPSKTISHHTTIIPFILRDGSKMIWWSWFLYQFSMVMCWSQFIYVSAARWFDNHDLFVHAARLFSDHIATLGSIFDSQLSWESSKFQLARWSHKEVLFPIRTTHPPPK